MEPLGKIKLPSLERIEAEMYKRKFTEFIQGHWRYVESVNYLHNWHIDCIGEHLEAVRDGQIKRMIINIPPRHMKSLSVSVFFPAWLWMSDPSKSFLFASYAQSLSVRDSIKCRRVIQSPVYKDSIKELHPDFTLTGDQNTKLRFENNHKGYRLATSVGGALTGEGADIIVIDDPHNVTEGESEQIRVSTLNWWDEAMSTRLNNPRTGVYIIIMQRVHEDDLTGHILAKNHGEYTHLCIPAEYEGNKIFSPLGWEDKRKTPDELLWKERVGRKQITELKKALGPYGSAGQLQQRPVSREGGLFKPEFAPIVKTVQGKLEKIVRYWDKAGSKGKGAYTAGVKIGKYTDGTYIVLDVVRGQWEALERERKMKQTAELDGKNVRIGIEQEGGSGGKESAQATIRNLSGYIVKADHPTGDKVARAEPFAVQFNAGNVSILKGEWNQDYIRELQMFPASKYKDQVDASSGAFNSLTEHKKVIVL